MKRSLLLAAAVATLASPATHALAWGSLVPGFNTHGCIDEAAYKALAADPAYRAAAGFPTLADVLANEGVNSDAVGNGPDNEGGTDYSEHYYNPRIGEPGQAKVGLGKAPTSVGAWFVQLATRTNAAKGAAWAAHFMADMSVPFHVNGEPGAWVTQAYAQRPDRTSLILPPEVTGNRALFSRPLISFLPTHDMDFKREADRYLATAKAAQAKTGKAYFDWFDPWYFNGVTDSPVSSSHLTWEGMARIAQGCPGPPTAFSELWPGNPAPQFERPVLAMRDTMIAFTKANARSTVASQSDFYNDPTKAMNQATASIYTMWRASFSAMHVKWTAAPVSEKEQAGQSTPIYKVTGKLANFAAETPTGARAKLSILGGPCQILPNAAAAIQPLQDVTPGVHPAGEWRVSVPSGAKCQLQEEVIGAYAKTPDLQYAVWRSPIQQAAAEGVYKGPITFEHGDFARPIIFQHGDFAHMSMHFQLRPAGALSIPATLSLTVNNGQVTGQLSGKIDCGEEIGYDTDDRFYCTTFHGQIKGTVDAKGLLTATYNGVYHPPVPSTWIDIAQVGGLTGQLTPKGAEGDLTVWFLDNRDHSKMWTITGTWSVNAAGH